MCMVGYLSRPWEGVSCALPNMLCITPTAVLVAASIRHTGRTSKLFLVNMNKQSRDTSSVLSEWHDRGERRPISSGDSTAYEYVLRGCFEFMLSYMRFAGEWLIKIHILCMTLMALRRPTEDLTEFTPGRCRYD